MTDSREEYVLMPREATRAMTMAGCDSLPSCEHVFGHAGEMLRNAYRKMVEVGAMPAAERSDAEIGEHLRQIKAFASVINERNFSDIALHIERQADAALSLPAAEDDAESRDALIEQCAKIADPWPGFNVGQEIQEPDLSVIEVRTKIAAAIRALAHSTAERPDAVTAEPVAYQKRPTFVADAKWTESGNTPDVADEDGQTMREFWREHGYEIRALYASPPSDAVTDQPFVEMLWKWFEDRGVNLRPERSTGLTADDFRVMLDEHEAALSLPAAHSECPHIKPPANLSTPCQICGALGPWFDSGDCKFSSADRATP